MAILHLTDASSGAPTLSGTDGALAAIMDWALVQNGWAIEATSGNYRVYRPGSGNRFRLCMRDEAAGSGAANLCTVRGAENFVSATSWTDPFPTVALQADSASNWIKSSTASATARSYDIFLETTWVMFICNFSSSTNVWEFHFFGDCPPALSGDSYNTICLVRGTTSTAAQWGSACSANLAPSGMPWYWTRTFDGTVKSPRGNPISTKSNGFGNIPSAPSAQSGPTTGIETEKVILSDTGVTSGTPSSTLALPTRAYLPNMRNPLHNGRNAVNTRDTYTMTGYSASFNGVCFTVSNSAVSQFAVVENSNTWTPPT